MENDDQLNQWYRDWRNHVSDMNVSQGEASFEKGAISSDSLAPRLTARSLSSIESDMLDMLRNSIAPSIGAGTRRGNLMQASASGVDERTNILRAGQILQLRPKAPTYAGREVFVVVLNVRGGKVEVVPFGPLQTPAFASEMITGMQDEALQVLCLWNAQWLPWKVALRSWHIANVPDQIVEEMQTLRTCLAAKKPLPEYFDAKVGTSEWTPADERFDYLAQEESIWEAFLF